jgi:hypothetical protein
VPQRFNRRGGICGVAGILCAFFPPSPRPPELLELELLGILSAWRELGLVLTFTGVTCGEVGTILFVGCFQGCHVSR